MEIISIFADHFNILIRASCWKPSLAVSIRHIDAMKVDDIESARDQEYHIFSMTQRLLPHRGSGDDNRGHLGGRQQGQW